MEETTIAQIRAMSGTLTDDFFYVTDDNQEGMWKYDPLDSSSTDNTGTILVTADEKRVKRVYEGPVHTDWFGFAKDGTDETAKLQSVLNEYTSILINKGTYTITPNNGNVTSGSSTNSTFHPLSDSIIEFESGAKLVCLNSGVDNTQVFNYFNVNNCKLLNPVIIGDRRIHSPLSGAGGMLIAIGNCSENISIIGGDLSEAWGDGIYISGANISGVDGTPDYSDTYVPTLNNAPASAWTDSTTRDSHLDELFENTVNHRRYKFSLISGTYQWLDVTGIVNVNIDGVHIHDCRRQGISIITGRNITIENCLINNIGDPSNFTSTGTQLGTRPSAAIDIEPNEAEQLADTINISNCIGYKCLHGICNSGSNVVINGCQFHDIRASVFWLAGNSLNNPGSKVLISDCTTYNSNTDAFDGTNTVEYLEIVRIDCSDVIISSCRFEKGFNSGITLKSTANNVQIIGNKIINVGGYAINSVAAAGTSGFIVSNNIIEDADIAITIAGLYSVISNNVINGASTGINMSSAAAGSVVSGNTLTGITGTRVMLLNAAECVIENNTLHNNSGVGIDAGSSMTNCIIKGNVIFNSSTYGIKSPSNSILEANIISLCGYSAIYSINAGLMIRGNVLFDNGQSSAVYNTSSGIELAAGADNCILIDNQVRSTTSALTYKPKYGVYLASGITGIKLINNNIQTGSGTIADYSDNATGTMLTDSKQTAMIDSSAGTLKILSIVNGTVTVV